jgi:hypothetical protein
MDLREIVRMSPDTVVGHEPVTERLNVKNESRRFNTDPLSDFLTSIGDEGAAFFFGDVGRYVQAFSWYTLCLTRAFQQCSVARRSERELRWLPVTVKYTLRQAQVARKLKSIGPYQELDYHNLIIHSCILLDRAIALSRRFLSGSNLPSFTSFARHKKFLRANPTEVDSRFRDYADRLASTTDWFEIPLRVLRDKYLMHSAERHMSVFGWSTDKVWDLEMITIIRASHGQKKLPGRVKVICFSPRRLARDVESFLSWFGEYGRTAMKDCPTRASSRHPKRRGRC